LSFSFKDDLVLSEDALSMVTGSTLKVQHMSDAFLILRLAVSASARVFDMEGLSGLPDLVSCSTSKATNTSETTKPGGETCSKKCQKITISGSRNLFDKGIQTSLFA
jgi:hypothetical protein